jgi:FkbM family methyltransferase
MNEITRIQNLFRKDAYHDCYRMQVIASLMRIHLNKAISKRSTAVQNVMGFKMAHLNLRTLCTLFDEIFVEGGYYIDLGTKRPEIVDCGSNIGMATLFFKKIFPECRITAFEPEPETFGILSRNIAMNGLKDVKAYNFAVSNEEGEISFYSDPEVPGSGMMSMMDARSSLGRTQKVRTVKLSDYLDREIDLLKLDVEGAEHQVFQDLDGTGKIRLINNMVIEYHHHMNRSSDNLSPLLGTLEKNGFGYQIADTVRLPFEKNAYQVGLIYAYKK